MFAAGDQNHLVAVLEEASADATADAARAVDDVSDRFASPSLVPSSFSMNERAASPSPRASTSRRPFESPRGHRQRVWPALLAEDPVPSATVRTTEVTGSGDLGGSHRESGSGLRAEWQVGWGARRTWPRDGAAVAWAGGHAKSRYIRQSATQALDRGWDVERLNLWNCGGIEALASTLYNAG
jgi:hypothetical protein